MVGRVCDNYLMQTNVNSPQKTMLSLHEAAKEVSRSSWTLRRDFYAGRLAAHKYTPHGKIYIKRVDLEAYINRARHGAVGEKYR